MPRLVLTVIGDDRSGLVRALADVVTEHGGNWEESQLAELAGKFAGIVVVSVPEDRAEEFATSLSTLDGLLEVAAHPGAEPEAEIQAGPAATDQLTIDLLGNDHPGIVREVSTVLSHHDLSIETMTTGTREAPMAGGLLFEAHVVVDVPAGSDTSALRADLERLAAELLVDIAVA
ncbi:glycine cleavage system regulatory protein [Humibacillus xanthopallidus]|uniref:Glycine cleavage system regulatory protein n=1 Tax=Humibacillus xanthopallidus TaxID=412689 RepID=A0A543PNS1_9MICO|nr:ACT domain-containing protein [Humibacillus xanthopallidus]TQN45700.1 glycine cleavage system regulatory protein [Humibacillus xanthopallidus]